MPEDFAIPIDWPHISIPPVDHKNGLWVPLWYEVLQRLYLRTGGDQDLINVIVVDVSTKADKSTQIIAGAGLDGGGTLAADVTLDVNIDEALDLVGTTVGSLLVRGASGWQLIEPGDDGFVLTSNGPGVLPTYQDGGGSCLEVVAASTGIVITTEPCGTVFTNES